MRQVRLAKERLGPFSRQIPLGRPVGQAVFKDRAVNDVAAVDAAQKGGFPAVELTRVKQDRQQSAAPDTSVSNTRHGPRS